MGTEEGSGTFWAFAYGSLIWQPGFAYEEVAPALLRGWHRAMCIYSTHYRGRPEVPGLVLGLDHGGSCKGVAYRVADRQAADVRRYLYEREMISEVYRPRFAPILLNDGRRVQAYLFISRPDHPQYAGKLAPEQAIAVIRQGIGCTGSSRDYLAATVAHLEALGLEDKALKRLLDMVDSAPPRTGEAG